MLLLWGCEYGCMLGRGLMRDEIWCVGIEASCVGQV